jgi:hypothetical protein
MLFKFKEIRCNQSIYVFPLFCVWQFCGAMRSKPYKLLLALSAAHALLAII